MIELGASEVQRYMRVRVPDLRERALGGERRGPCPVHKGTRDNFAVNIETGAWFCHSRCSRGGSIFELEELLTGADFASAKAEIFRIIGRNDGFENGHACRNGHAQSGRAKLGRIVATYDYVNEAGELLSQVTRHHPPKDFRQRRPNGSGGWVNSLDDTRRVLYHLPNLIKADTVYVCEGEKDVHAVEALGLTATCNPMGAGNWKSEYDDSLRGKHIVVFPDNDAAGRKHAKAVCESLLNKAASVRIVEIPGLPDKGDVSDWVEAGGDLCALLAIVKEVGIDFKLEGETGKEKPAEPLPSIVANDRQLREISKESLCALQAANDPPSLFERSGNMVSIRKEETGRYSISDITPDALRGYCTRAANYVRNVMTKNGPKTKSCSPPKDMVLDICNLSGSEWEFPPLQALIESPALRPDGSIITSPGYDPATALYYAPIHGFLMPAVSTAPDCNDIKRALECIDDAIGEFPFVGLASRANAIAALLTPVCRPAIRGPTPLALMDAPAAGSGKTLLAEVLSLIATGREGALVSLPRDNDELRKQLTSTLREGSTVIVIDNINRRLDSGEFCKILTASVHADRLLGKSEDLHLPIRCSWIATGNNIQLGGDMPRRCYWIRMDAQTSKPHGRTGFRHPDLKGWVRANRGKLLASLLTLATAWFKAGRPKPKVSPVGSFENWTTTIGGILQHANVSCFLENTDELYSKADGESTQWENFLLTVDSILHGAPFRSADLVAIINEKSENQNEPSKRAAELLDNLPDWLAGNRERSDGLQRAIGIAFAEKVGKRFGDSSVHLERPGTKQRAALWQVVNPNSGGGRT